MSAAPKLSLGGLVLILAGNSMANPPTGFVYDLSDQQLSSLRGRFVSNNGVTFFGIQFVSTLISAQQQQSAMMSINVDTRATQPNMAIRIGGTPQSISSDSTIMSESNNIEGSGVVQVLQLQGTANQSVNQTSLSQPQSNPIPEGQIVGTGQFQQSGSLGQTYYQVSSHYIGYQLKSSDGNVILEQGLRGSDLSKGLLQLNRVNGEGITSINQTKIWFSR